MKTPTKSDDEIREAIKALPYAKTLFVSSEPERQKALNIANGLGKRVVTRKTKNGFQVIALE